MDKVLINNQIVVMRKFVKQAKIRAINNYTKEIRLLQNRKGNDNETSKHKRKAERLLSKVAILRKIPPDTISRKALSKDKDWADVLKEKNIPLEDQCYAMLANYGPVQSEVEKFHKKHWDLVPKIAALFKSWEEKSKNPMIKQERKKAKELRKSLKAANVKLGKDNPNSTPIGPKYKDNIDKSISKAEAPQDILEKEKKCDALNEASDEISDVLNSKPIQNDTTPMTLQNMGTEETNDVENEKIKESKNIPRKSPIKKFVKKNFKEEESKINLIATANKEELEEKQTANSDIEEKDLESKSEVNSLESESEESPYDSEDDDASEEECIAEYSESETEEISEDTKEMQKVGKVTMKALDKLQKKLEVMAEIGHKAYTYEKRKSSYNAKGDSAKNPKPNNLKAITMLNLNELEGLDEIPIEKTDIINEDTGEKKRKKDPFFLGKGGEVVSESEDSDNLDQEQDGLDFKKRKFNSFERKSSDGDFFKKRKFSGNAPQHQKSGFKENGFQRNKRNTNFEDKSNSFRNREKPSFEFNKDKGFKSVPKDQFKNKRETKSFGNRSSEKKQNFHQEASNKAHFQKDKLSSSLKKSSSDDKPLHPSWEAKKKLKESAKAKFQGKRIVFGD